MPASASGPSAALLTEARLSFSHVCGSPETLVSFYRDAFATTTFLRSSVYSFYVKGGAVSGFAGECKEPDNKDLRKHVSSLQRVNTSIACHSRHGGADNSISLYINQLLLFMLMLLSSNDFSLSYTSKSEHQPRLFFYRKTVY